MARRRQPPKDVPSHEQLVAEFAEVEARLRQMLATAADNEDAKTAIVFRLEMLERVRHLLDRPSDSDKFFLREVVILGRFACEVIPRKHGL